MERTSDVVDFLMRILGVHDGIDASACLLEDGVLRYAMQEERFTGVKQQGGYPKNAVNKILTLAGLDITQIDEIALSTLQFLRSPGIAGHGTAKPAPFKQLLKEATLLKPFYGYYEDLAPVIKKRVPAIGAFFNERQRAARLAWLRAESGYFGPVTVVEHHAAHAASAFYSAPWRDEPVLVLTSDAVGDGLCATVNVGENGVMTRISETVHTNSMGYLYSYVTSYLGMRPHRDEYKVMGLAPWGKSDESYDVLKRYIGLGDDPLAYKRGIPEPLHYIRPRLMSELHTHRFDNIAYGVQRVLDELMVSWVRNAMLKTGVRQVAAGGGVFMNVKTNKLIREMTDGFFPMPSAGDESTSIGAAQWVYAQRMLESGQEPRIEPLGPLYLGDEPGTWWASNAGMPDDVTFDKWQSNWDYVHTAHVDDLAADLILKGEIVARARGPMEFGARALGNRSILCDATDLRNVGIINAAIKSRDFWMPFAPVILEARADELLRRPVYAPYMTMAFDTTDAGRECLRAAIHQADKTVRPQILRHTWNPDYYSILRAFEQETGHGGMLNTSFNLHGFPIVRGAKDALHVFLNSGLKHLVLGDYLLSKK